jgi:hypothetical protein
MDFAGMRCKKGLLIFCGLLLLAAAAFALLLGGLALSLLLFGLALLALALARFASGTALTSLGGHGENWFLQRAGVLSTERKIKYLKTKVLRPANHFKTAIESCFRCQM